MKVIKLCFRMLGTFWKEVFVQDEVNLNRIRSKSESLLKPSKATLKGLLELKNRQLYKTHNLFD